MTSPRGALWLRFGLAVAAFAVALPVFVATRDYPWTLGIIMALAIATLVFLAVMTVETLRGVYRS